MRPAFVRGDQNGRRQDADPRHEEGLGPGHALREGEHYPQHGAVAVVARQLRPVEGGELHIAHYRDIALGRLLRGDDHDAVGVLFDRHVHRRSLDRPRARRSLLARSERPRREGCGRAIGVHGHDVLPDRHRRQPRQRHGDVDDKHDDDDHVDRPRQVPAWVLGLLRHVRDRLDARVGDCSDRKAVQEVAPSRSDSPLDLLDEDLRLEQEHEGEGHDDQLSGEVHQRQYDVDARRLFDADHVDRHQQDGRDNAPDGIEGVLPEDRPEHRKVLGNEQGRDGDGRRVDEHLPPSDPEARELVEGPAHEARRATRLWQRGCRLGVGPCRHHEQEASQDEDERCGSQRRSGDDTQRVVDRGADVAVPRAEERRHAKYLIELLALPMLASSHCPLLVHHGTGGLGAIETLSAQ